MGLSGHDLTDARKFPAAAGAVSMDFFYPNLQNDMWRIVGLVFFGDKGYFLTPDAKTFDKERIVRFCEEKGLALYDTAEEIIRLKTMLPTIFFK